MAQSARQFQQDSFNRIPLSTAFKRTIAISFCRAGYYQFARSRSASQYGRSKCTTALPFQLFSSATPLDILPMCHAVAAESANWASSSAMEPGRTALSMIAHASLLLAEPVHKTQGTWTSWLSSRHTSNNNLSDQDHIFGDAEPRSRPPLSPHWPHHESANPPVSIHNRMVVLVNVRQAGRARSLRG